MLFIYYGMGKGKTSALNGSAIRAFGAKKKVIIYRFLKNLESSEDEVLRKIGIDVRKSHPVRKFVFEMNQEEKEQAKIAALKLLEEVIKNKDNYDVIILDEILDLTVENVGFITPKELKSFLIEVSKDKDVFVSGHKEDADIFEIADLLSKVVKEKHYYEKGIQGRKGIEY